MTHSRPIRLLFVLLILVFIAGLPASTSAQTTTGVQEQAPAEPPQSTPVDPAEAGGTTTQPLRIGPVTLSGSAWIESAAMTDHPTNQDDTFRIRRARIGFAGNIAPKVGWNISGELTSETPLRNAFLLFRITEQLNVRVGQATPPSSIERGTSPLVLELIDRSRLTTQLTNPLDIGVTVMNDEPYKGWVGYAVSVFNGSGFNRSDDNDSKDVSARLQITPPGIRGLTVNVNGARGEQVAGTRTRGGVGVQYNTPQLKVLVEGLRETSSYTATRGGVVMMGAYRIKPASPTPHFRMLELAARYFVFNDPGAAAGSGTAVIDDDGGGGAEPAGVTPATTHEIQAGASYYINLSARLMGNVIVPTDARVGTTFIGRLQITF